MMHLRLEEVTSIWNGFSLEEIEFEIGDREYFALLGPSGAGKTLLLETIMGFNKLKRGRIFADDDEISSLPPFQRGFGYVPHGGALFPHLNVRQNIEFGLRMMKIDQTSRKKKSDEAMNELSIVHLEKRSPENLSAGERQKVALARCLVMKPRLMLLDEPFSSIDAEARQSLRNLLKRLHRELETSFIHVTHDQLEAISLAESVAIMSGGRVVQKGKIDHVFSSPKSEFVARFLGYENILIPDRFEDEGDIIRLTLNGKDLLCSKGNSSANRRIEPAGRHKIAIRPDQVMVSKNPTACPNCMRGKIIDFSDLGPLVELTVDVGFLLKSVVTKNAFVDNQLQKNEGTFWINVKPSSLVILNE